MSKYICPDCAYETDEPICPHCNVSTEPLEVKNDDSASVQKYPEDLLVEEEKDKEGEDVENL